MGKRFSDKGKFFKKAFLVLSKGEDRERYEQCQGPCVTYIHFILMLKWGRS